MATTTSCSETFKLSLRLKDMMLPCDQQLIEYVKAWLTAIPPTPSPPNPSGASESCEWLLRMIEYRMTLARAAHWTTRAITSAAFWILQQMRLVPDESSTEAIQRRLDGELLICSPDRVEVVRDCRRHFGTLLLAFPELREPLLHCPITEHVWSCTGTGDVTNRCFPNHAIVLLVAKYPFSTQDEESSEPQITTLYTSDAFTVDLMPPLYRSHHCWATRTVLTQRQLDQNPLAPQHHFDNRLAAFRVGEAVSSSLSSINSNVTSTERHLLDEADEASRVESTYAGWKKGDRHIPLTTDGEPVIVVGPIATRVNMARFNVVYARLNGGRSPCWGAMNREVPVMSDIRPYMDEGICIWFFLQGAGDAILLHGMAPHEFIKTTGSVTIAWNSTGAPDLVACSLRHQLARADAVRQTEGVVLDRSSSLGAHFEATEREHWHDHPTDGIWHGVDPLDIYIPIFLRAHASGVHLVGVIRQWLLDNVGMAAIRGSEYKNVLLALTAEDGESMRRCLSAIDEKKCWWMRCWRNGLYRTPLETKAFDTYRARVWAQADPTPEIRKRFFGRLQWAPVTDAQPIEIKREERAKWRRVRLEQWAKYGTIEQQESGKVIRQFPPDEDDEESEESHLLACEAAQRMDHHHNADDVEGKEEKKVAPLSAAVDPKIHRPLTEEERGWYGTRFSDVAPPPGVATDPLSIGFLVAGGFSRFDLHPRRSAGTHGPTAKYCEPQSSHDGDPEKAFAPE